MKRIARLIAMACSLPLAGCADINTTNQLIAEANKGRLEAYGRSLAACGDNAACQVGVTGAYYSGAGQQPFFRPDTPVDYLKAGLPYADLVERIVGRRYGGTSGDSSGFVVTGDGNSFNVGNRLGATEQSLLSLDWSNSMQETALRDNRFYLLDGAGQIDDEGIVGGQQ